MVDLKIDLIDHVLDTKKMIRFIGSRRDCKRIEIEFRWDKLRRDCLKCDWEAWD